MTKRVIVEPEAESELAELPAYWRARAERAR